jgi:predicted transglutaminase-like cysteine proteinase
MRRRRVNFIVVLGLLCATGGAMAHDVAALHSNPAASHPSAFMRVFGDAVAPDGFVRFCEAMPQECPAVVGEETPLGTSPERLRQLDAVNRDVNHSIAPATDLELYGLDDYWALPTQGSGDCEDYALLKRHNLMRLGWSANALLLTVVRDAEGAGHAVLTARTAQGDFILDNKTDEVRLWSATPYGFVMRQASRNARAFVALDPADGWIPTVISGLRNSNQP